MGLVDDEEVWAKGVSQNILTLSESLAEAAALIHSSPSSDLPGSHFRRP